MIRAKFKVNSVTEPREVDRYNNTTKENEKMTIVDVQLTPVTGGSEENEKFYAWTPGGYLTLSTVNLAIAKELVIGKEFYLDLTPAE